MAKRKPKGLGDTVEQITEATGIKAVVEAVSKATGIDCGCEGRKEVLNKLWSYRKPNCLEQEDIDFLLPYFQFKKDSLTPKEQWRIKDIYKAVFNEVIQDSNCASCWRDTLNDLKKVYETQQNV
jgi:hypothetical protein